MTSQIIHTINIYLASHPHMGLFFAFLVAFLEALPIIGTIVPGAITMTVVGWMIGTGLLDPIIGLLLSSLGAVAGDMIGFFIGKRYRQSIHQIWPFSRYPKILSHGEAFFIKHGGKSIVIGRFVGPARSTVPLVAGVMQLNPIRFFIAVIPTAILWSIVYTIPGIILGEFSTEVPPALLTEYLLMGLGIIIMGWAIFWLIQRFFSNIQDGYHSVIDSYWNFLNNHRGTRLVTHYIKNHQDPTSHHQLSRLLLASVFWCVFIIITVCVALHSSLTYINMPIFHLTQSLRIYHLDGLFSFITDAGMSAVMILYSILITAILCIFRQWRAAMHLLAATVIATAIVLLIKHGFYHPRPAGFMVIQSGSSFPSGHTTLSTVVLGMLAFFTSRLVNPRWRLLVFTLFGLLILSIAFSRLYLGAHWFLDIMGGLTLGLAVILTTITHYQRLPTTQSKLTLPQWQWFSLIIVAFGLINLCYAAIHHSRTQFQSTPFKKVVYLDLKSWWKSPLTYTPTYRENRLGQPSAPLNIQMAANLDTIKKTLNNNHWTAIKRTHHFKDAIARLTNQAPQYHLPLFELLFKNERPALVAYHRTQDTSHVYLLRLWNSHIILMPTQTPLWIGMLTNIRSPSHRLALPHGSLSRYISYTDISKLMQLHQQHWQQRIVPINNSHLLKKFMPTAWDKKIIIFKIKNNKKSNG